ncbi:uncharacterized protein LOC117119862 isoform X4 [Anneissia japonica]|uniref:uncharacterized protein LOC117119862 isoform X4 n=1 Tax=Anneissia japonica TaxID=1529436 RepID=UPI001425588C|nr:uncharacterized protein LOC117119862 isoform X4 [Anneissia japonica]XP_033120770.1 uncharacterized protein LOC117119862 isoform X4 [Anneissia japonica]XP_033120776.1 uncharacterized protein LOC117119862 isoform X4 [Anneissia japonica]XP_033120781.1 uncharacterized protein LOC117119862 isoform X4 [Anneissia japonica]
MSGGCCGSTSAKVASIILIIIGIISIIAAIVVLALADNILFVGVPVIIGGAMIITEGVFGLIFAYNAKNRCWMITVNVVSIIMLVISVVWLILCLLFAALFITFKVGCNNCDPNDYSCNENCGISFEYVIPGGVFMVLFSAITLATSIVLIVSSCTCRRSNMDSARI